MESVPAVDLDLVEPVSMAAVKEQPDTHIIPPPSPVEDHSLDEGAGGDESHVTGQKELESGQTLEEVLVFCSWCDWLLVNIF